MCALIRADEKGFTLLEIMVAAAIMAIAFTAVLRAHSHSISMNMAANFHTQAPLLAAKVLAEWEFQNGTLENFPGFSYEINEQMLDSESFLSEESTTDSVQIMELTCTILYDDGTYSYTTKVLKLITQ